MGGVLYSGTPLTLCNKIIWIVILNKSEYNNIIKDKSHGWEDFKNTITEEAKEYHNRIKRGDSPVNIITSVYSDKEENILYLFVNGEEKEDNLNFEEWITEREEEVYQLVIPAVENQEWEKAQNAFDSAKIRDFISDSELLEYKDISNYYNYASV